MSLLRYFADLKPGKVALWCYLLWYLVTVASLFDPAPSVWLNSAGISLVIGVALRLSVSPAANSRPDPWQTFRLFLMPFCVSSFATLIKGRGYILVVPTQPGILLRSMSACLLFVGAHRLLRRWLRPAA